MEDRPKKGKHGDSAGAQVLEQTRHSIENQLQAACLLQSNARDERRSVGGRSLCLSGAVVEAEGVYRCKVDKKKKKTSMYEDVHRNMCRK